LGSEFKSSKYYQYVSGLNVLPALNSSEMHHFWTDTCYPQPSSQISMNPEWEERQ
jgi:hypothetical protein